MKHTTSVSAVCCALLTACTSASMQDKSTHGELTREHFYQTSKLSDDSLDILATISTVDGYQEKHGLLGIVWNDNFLRVFIDKKTGSTKFQIYQTINYDAASWMFYRSVSYETPSGPNTADLTDIKKSFDCSGASKYQGCSYVEHVGFYVSETILRRLSSGYTPGETKVWKFKFTALSGDTLDETMTLAEIAGALDAVDAYRSGHGLKAE